MQRRLGIDEVSSPNEEGLALSDLLGGIDLLYALLVLSQGLQHSRKQVAGGKQANVLLQNEDPSLVEKANEVNVAGGFHGERPIAARQSVTEGSNFVVICCHRTTR